MKQKKITAAVLIIITAALIGVVVLSFVGDEKTPPADATHTESSDSISPIEISPVIPTIPVQTPGGDIGNEQEVTGELHIDVSENTDKKEPYIVGEIIIIPEVREE